MSATPNKKVPWIPILVAIVVVGALIVAAASSVERQRQADSSSTPPKDLGYAQPSEAYEGADVPQPIAFSHQVHAGDNQINCLYCHTYARRSAVAGIPPTSKCMGCHSHIADDKPEIERLTALWEDGKSPRWKKVHDMPDFVRFTHERHLDRLLFANPKVDIADAAAVCATCHGDLTTMTVAKKSKPLTMGYCVRCHEANQGPADCADCHK